MGGEALYNSHEHDQETGYVLRKLGIPCIIKARVPMKSLHHCYLPDTKMMRVYLDSRGHTLENEVDHEGYIVEALSSENLIEIIEYPNQKFIELTKCDVWNENPFS